MANTLNLGNGNWATKKDSLLGYNSENGNFKPLPFDFTRASSATVVNKAGLIETVGSGEPRIDFSNDANGALLLEPSRTNLIQYSEEFSQWTEDRVLVYDNQIISPNGILNADKISENSENNVHRLYSNTFSAVSGSDYSISVFAKKGTATVLQLGITTTSVIGTGRANFDLQNGVLGSVSGGNAIIENYGNGWYKCIFTFESLSTASAPVSFLLTNNDLTASRNPFYTGNTNQNLYIYGAQLEEGSYATSYIPTSGSAVTRVADNAYQQGATQVIGQSEGTMFLEFIPKDSSTLQILYQAKNSSGTVGQVDIRLQSGLIRALANDGGVQQFFINGGSYTVGAKYKVAIRYKLNDSKLYINGTDSGSNTSCSFTSSSLDQVSFADNLSSFLPSVDIIDARLYSTALTDNELQQLTAI